MNNFDILQYFLCCGLIPFTVVVNKTLYQKVKSEDHLEKGKIVQSIIKTYAIVQCVCFPSFMLCFGIYFACDQNLILLELPTKSYIISSLRFIFSLLRDYIGFHTLIIAITRYTFIVFDSRAEIIGIQKMRKLFISTSFIFPLISAVIYDATAPMESVSNISFSHHWKYLFIAWKWDPVWCQTWRTKYGNPESTVLLCQHVFSWLNHLLAEGSWVHLISYSVFQYHRRTSLCTLIDGI